MCDLSNFLLSVALHRNTSHGGFYTSVTQLEQGQRTSKTLSCQERRYLINMDNGAIGQLLGICEFRITKNSHKCATG